MPVSDAAKPAKAQKNQYDLGLNEWNNYKQVRNSGQSILETDWHYRPTVTYCAADLQI